MSPATAAPKIRPNIESLRHVQPASWPRSRAHTIFGTTSAVSAGVCCSPSVWVHYPTAQDVARQTVAEVAADLDDELFLLDLLGLLD